MLLLGHGGAHFWCQYLGGRGYLKLRVQSQPGLQHKFQDGQGYKENPVLNNKQANKQTKVLGLGIYSSVVDCLPIVSVKSQKARRN